jgi:DNA-binding beta-propeller fold protein YncE
MNSTMIVNRAVKISRTAITVGLVAGLVCFGPVALASARLTPSASASGTLTPPACTNKTAEAPSLPGIKPSTLSVPGQPFGAAVVPGGRFAVVAVEGAKASEVAVFALRGGKPRLMRLASLPGPPDAAGLAISHNGRYLAVTEDSGTAVLNLPELLAGHGNPVLGVLKDGGIGTIEATFSADSRYLFVSDEYSPALSVFDLARALRAGFSARGVAVGKLRLGPSVVGSVLSPDGGYLYMTSEAVSDNDAASGLLQVISVAKAERDPAASLVAAVRAGCQPVRVALSDHGSLAWVTARGSDALLAFDTRELRTNPAHALRADVRVGPQPVGVVLIDGGQFALTANSARFTAPNSPQTVSVVSARAVLAGRPALIGTIPAGKFPREFGYDPVTGEVVLSNYLSGTIEIFRFPSPRWLR